MPVAPPDSPSARRRWSRTAKATLRHLPRHLVATSSTLLPLGTPLLERSPESVVDVGELARDVETHAATLAALLLTWCPRSNARDTAVRDLEQLADLFRVLASDAPSEETTT